MTYAFIKEYRIMLDYIVIIDIDIESQSKLTSDQLLSIVVNIERRTSVKF